MAEPKRTPTPARDWTCPYCGQRFIRRNQRHSCNRQSIDDFFGDDIRFRPLFDATHAFLKSLGPVDVAATKTQISFRARIRFAYLWFPSRTRGRGPPELFLTFDLRRRQPSARIKESVNPRGDLWTHHFPFQRTGDLDDEVKHWLAEAYHAASTP